MKRKCILNIHNIVRLLMSRQLLVNKHNRLHDSRLSLIRLSGDLHLVADKTTKNKPWVDYEPHSAHGHAVKKKNNNDKKQCS